jgi:acyl-CoA dehydrogenase
MSLPGFEPAPHLSPLERDLVAHVERLCAGFPPAYWLEHDQAGRFPEEFYQAVARAGFLGIAMPTAYGGAGLGIRQAALLMERIAASGAGMSGASAVHINIFGLHPVVVHGTEEQKARFLPPLIRGEEKACFGVTEPDAGLDTLNLSTRAHYQGGRYVITGQKIWTSTAQEADRILLLARTTPRSEVRRKTEGLSLFYARLDRSRVEIRPIAKMGRHAVDSNILHIDGLEVPEEDRIGAEGEGFHLILSGMNPERILIAAEAVGLGRAALARAAAYARERVVFGRPIGANQGIQHPLAAAWAELEAAFLLTLAAAERFDAGEDCGAYANAAKLLAAEAGHRAAERAVLTHGGMGYAQDYHVERFLRESYIPRLAPVSRELILCYLAERVLGLPRSY